MAVTTSSTATIKGITYTRGTTFTAQLAVRGTRDSEGSGTTIQITQGTTYKFYSYATGDSVTNPYLIQDSSGNQVGWFKEDIFPEGTYTVSFNANGGSGAPSSQTKQYGIDLVLSSTTPTKSGCNFVGWGTSSSDTSVDYYAGDIYSANEAITFYAIWEVKESSSTTNTILYVSASNSEPSSKTITAYPYSSKDYIYWKVDNLQSALEKYLGFYLYRGDSVEDVSPGFVNGKLTSEPSGYVDSITSASYPNTTDKFIIDSFVYPSNNCKIGTTSNKYFALTKNITPNVWKIGTVTGEPNEPQPVSVSLPRSNWITNAFNVNVSTVGTTTATLTWSWLNGKNKNRYIYRAMGHSSSISTAGASSASYAYGRTSIIGSNVSSFTHTLTNLPVGTTTKVYLSVELYASTYSADGKKYYGVYNNGKNYIEVTTDAESYSATLSLESKTSTTATYNISGLSSTANLDNGIYSSTTNSTTATELAGVSLGKRDGNTGSITIENLDPGKTNTRYIYVYSVNSKKYYKIGAITVDTNSFVYYADNNGNLIPCYTYMLIDGALKQVLFNVPAYKT